MVSGAVVANLTRPLARRGAVFDGVDDKVTITSDSLLTNANTMTICFWAYSDNTNNGASVVDRWASIGTRSWRIKVSTSQRLVFWVSDDGTAFDSTTTPNDSGLINRTWTHIAITYDKGTFKLYQNGVNISAADDTLTKTNLYTATTSDMDIGKESVTHFKGTIADVRLYHKVLSASQISDIFNGSPVTDELKGRWKLDTDYTDSVGSNDGTNSGSRLAAIDDQVANSVSGARVTASDQYMIAVHGDKILTTVVEEAP